MSNAEAHSHDVASTSKSKTSRRVLSGEAELYLITDGLPVIIAYIDQNHHFLFSNRAHQEHWGCTHKQIIGQHMKNVLGVDNYERALPYLQRALNGVHTTFEMTVDYAGRGKRYAKIDYVPHIEKDGEIAGCFVLAQDLSDKKAAEEERLRLIERYEALYNKTPVMLHSIDRDGKIVNVSHYWLEIMGYKREEVIGKMSVDFLTPESAAFAKEKILPLFFKSGFCKDVPYQFRKKNGEIIDVLLSATAEWDEDGQIERSLAVVVDITEQKRAEDALRLNEERFRRLVETTKVIPWEADIDSWIFTYVGPQANEILGYPVDEWHKPNFWVEHLHPEDRNDAIRICLENCQTLNKFEFEYRMMAANGTYVWFRDIVSVFYNSLGKRYLQGFLVDITESKKAEEDKLELEKQLRHSQKMEALGTLAGGIAHDFNNILGGIIGYSELALSRIPEDSSLHGYVSQVHTSAYRAKDLVGQILTFSQKSKVASHLVNCKKLVEEVLAFAKATLPATVQIATHWPDETMIVRADSSQLHQVLLNICTNAAHAMEERGGLLDVAVESVEVREKTAHEHGNLVPGFYVRITIRDTGHGMSEEVRKRIFEPYFTTKKVGRGSGLGLSVAHGIVASHGGTITVWSALQKGSRFSIYLPRVFEETFEEEKNSPELSVGKGSVLFIDDEPMLAQLGKDMLETLGYTVYAFTNTSHAISFFEKHNYEIDLIITDRTMPNMAGESLIGELKKINPAVPAIICTGYSASLDRDKLIQIGAKSLLPKPFSLAELSEVASQAISNKSE